MDPLGASVATGTCGQDKPLKIKFTVCVYWIWFAVTMIVRGGVTGTAGSTVNLRDGRPKRPWPVRLDDDWPWSQKSSVTPITAR